RCQQPFTADSYAAGNQSAASIASVQHTEAIMRAQPSAMTLDVDCASLSTLSKALRGWGISNLNGLQPSQVFRPKNLLVLGFRDDVRESLDLCRFLAAAVTNPNRGSVREGALPLIVLLAAEQQHLMLAVGARECLILPVHPRQIRRLLVRALREHHAGTHTLNLHQPACHEPWRDVGGES
ncbi:MAG: hypothetical protein AB7K24_04930, partial [Gemmataceae bacterium]